MKRRFTFFEVLIISVLATLFFGATPIGRLLHAVASEVVIGYENETLPILNEELRKLLVDEQIKSLSALNLRSKKITSLATPTASTDAANKGYVDSVSGNVGTKSVNETNIADQYIVYYNQTADEMQYGTISTLYSAGIFQTIFHWGMTGGYDEGTVEHYIGGKSFGTSNPDLDAHSYDYWAIKRDTFYKIFDFQFPKIPGIDTVMLFFYMVTTGVNDLGTCTVNCGGLTQNITYHSATPAWVNVTGWDISSLTDNVLYNGNVSCKSNTTVSGTVYVGATYIYGY